MKIKLLIIVIVICVMAIISIYFLGQSSKVEVYATVSFNIKNLKKYQKNFFHDMNIPLPFCLLCIKNLREKESELIVIGKYNKAINLDLTDSIDGMKALPRDYISKFLIKKLSRLKLHNLNFDENDFDKLGFVIFLKDNNGTVCLFDNGSFIITNSFVNNSELIKLFNNNASEL